MSQFETASVYNSNRVCAKENGDGPDASLSVGDGQRNTILLYHCRVDYSSEAVWRKCQEHEIIEHEIIVAKHKKDSALGHRASARPATDAIHVA